MSSFETLMAPFYIFSDIETEALRGYRLLQIAAVTQDFKTFSIHINPKEEIPIACTNLTGLYFHKGQLYKKGKIIPSVSARRALIQYRDWLESFKQPVTLVFHNGFSFDINILLRHFLRLKIEPPSNVENICDTLPTFRKLISIREIENFKLTTLAAYVGFEFKLAHDALYDSEILAKICIKFTEKADISLETLFSHYCKPFREFLNKAKHRHDSHEKQNLDFKSRK